MKPSSLTWSISRSTLLHHCPKKYFFQYYTDFLKHFDQTLWLDALLAKNLNALNMWFWQIAHQALSKYVTALTQTKSAVDIKTVLCDLFSDADFEFEMSKKRDYSSYNKQIKFWLVEHFMWKDIDQAYSQAKTDLQRFMIEFTYSTLHAKILSSIEQKKRFYIEKKKPDFEKMQFICNQAAPDVPIRAQIDLWIIHDSKRYTIIDRKSWKLPEYEETTISHQLSVYALKVLTRLWKEGLWDIRIECFEYYLQEGQLYGGTISQENLEEWIKFISEDIRYLKTFIQDENVAKNLPKATHYFPRTLQESKCQSCKFQQVCKKLKLYEEKDVYLI